MQPQQPAGNQPRQTPPPPAAPDKQAGNPGGAPHPHPDGDPNDLGTAGDYSR